MMITTTTTTTTRTTANMVVQPSGEALPKTQYTILLLPILRVFMETLLLDAHSHKQETLYNYYWIHKLKVQAMHNHSLVLPQLASCATRNNI